MGEQGTPNKSRVERQWNEWLKAAPIEGASADQEYRWHQQAVSLIRELLESEPKNLELRIQLAQSLLWLGRDEKVRMDNRARARKLLQEAAALNPDDGRSYYHLGWLAQLRGDFEHATTYFDHALSCSRLGPDLRIKALCNLIKVYSQQGDEIQTTHCVNEARKVLREHQQELGYLVNEYRTFLEYAEVDLHITHHSYPFTLAASSGVIRRLTYDDAMELQHQSSVYPLTLCLNQVQDRLIGPKGAHNLEFTMSQVVERLIYSERQLPSRELYQEFWPGKSRTNVTSNIRRIRVILKDCLGSDAPDPILTNSTTNGTTYAWNQEIPWQVLRDVNEPL